MFRLSNCLRRRSSIAVRFLPTVDRGVRTSSISLSDSVKEVPVNSYTTDGPVSSEDPSRKATAFDKGILHKMTPTMKRFTLDGKVALVTG